MLLRLLLPLFALPLLAQNDWDEPFPPHRIADNLYYVGSKGLSSYLVTSPKGHILINASFDRTVPIIQASVEKLGYKMGDIKVLLSSHAHDDHVGGLARMKALTGAKVVVMDRDVLAIETGGRKGQYLYKSLWEPCKVDQLIHDGAEITVGGPVLRAHLTPGHTAGNTTWSLEVTDRGKRYTAVIIGSPNVNPGFQLVNNKDYPDMAQDYARTFRVLKALKGEIFLGAHGLYYNMAEKFKKLNAGNPNPFVDPDGYKEYVAEREQYYLYTLEKQQKR